MFVVDGVSYPTAEHFMMVQKARMFGDDSAAAEILQASSPVDAKAAGRKVRGYEDEMWVAGRYGIVVEGNLAKFGQNPDLLAYLVSTAGRVLVEASPVDQVWGSGLAADDARSGRPCEWRGQNLLGFALMEVRDRLT